MDKTDTSTHASLNAPARGILKEDARTPPFTHARMEPGDGLNDLLDYFWHVAWKMPEGQHFTQRVLSHPSVHLVFESGRLYAAGPSTTCFERTLQGHGEVASAKLLPGHVCRILPGPATRYTDAEVPLDDLFSKELMDALHTSMMSAQGIEARVDLWRIFLRTHGQPPEHAHLKSAEITAWIADHPEALRVQDICDAFSIHERALQRLFSHHVGVSPKWVIGRYRMHEAAGRLEQGSEESLTELAHSLGYFDQAHFTREFKKITGDTPSAYRSRSSP